MQFFLTFHYIKSVEHTIKYYIDAISTELFEQAFGFGRCFIPSSNYQLQKCLVSSSRIVQKDHFLIDFEFS